MNHKRFFKTFFSIIFIAFFSFTLSAEDAIDFKLNFIEGQSFNYKIECKNKCVSTYVENNENKKDDIDVNVKINIKEVVKSKDNDTYVIQSNYSDMKIDMSTQDGEVKIDYFNEDPSKRITYNFKDKEEEAKIKESIEESMNGFSVLFDNKNYESTITEKNEVILKDLFIVIESLFPKNPVKVGDTWQINYDDNSLPFKFMINAKFKDKRDNKIFIEYEGKANINDNLKSQSGLLEFDINFSGQEILDDSSFSTVFSKINYIMSMKAEEEEDSSEVSESCVSIDGILEKTLIK